MPLIPDSANYSTWLFGQSAVVVVLMLWIASLHLALRRERREKTASEERNAELSERLVDVLLEGSKERSERREKTLNHVLEAIERNLKGPSGD